MRRARVPSGPWGELRVVPALISFLQTDSEAGRSSDELLIPAFKAQSALQRITEYLFPFDVAASRKAWAHARALPDPKQRRAALAEDLMSAVHR